MFFSASVLCQVTRSNPGRTVTRWMRSLLRGREVHFTEAVLDRRSIVSRHSLFLSHTRSQLSFSVSPVNVLWWLHCRVPARIGRSLAGLGGWSDLHHLFRVVVQLWGAPDRLAALRTPVREVVYRALAPWPGAALSAV